MLNISVDEDIDKRPFIRSYLGRFAFLIAVSATHFFFLSLADHTPPFLGRGPGENAAPGIFLSPIESPNFASHPLVLVFIAITAVAVAFSDVIIRNVPFSDIIVKKVNKLASSLDTISNIKKSYSHSKRKSLVDNTKIYILPTIAAIIYTVLFIIGILFWPNIGIEGRNLLNQPKAVWVGILYQTFAIFFVAYFYHHPIFPKGFPRSVTNDWGFDWEVYIRNQWRFVQVLLTTVLSVFLGTAIPFTANSGTFGISGTISLIGLLITGPVAIILFIAVRLRNMERMIRINT